MELVKVDITASEADKKKMRELAGDDGALPPQLAKGDVYLGVGRNRFRRARARCSDHV